MISLRLERPRPQSRPPSNRPGNPPAAMKNMPIGMGSNEIKLSVIGWFLMYSVERGMRR